jgi:hypothetical protein
MKEEKLDIRIIKEVLQKKRNPFIKMSNGFIKELFFDEKGNAVVDFKITEMRIVFLIHNTFTTSNSANLFMFQPKEEPKQLKLFEDEFLSEQNSFIKVTIKNSNISPDQNTKHIESAMEFLEGYKKEWYTSYNSKGEKIRSYGGLISMPSYTEKGYTSFLINSYWLKKIVEIDTYTYFLLETAFKISSTKDMLFLMWLAPINKQHGTTVSLQTLNEKFNLNYQNTKNMVDGFLKPIKARLDRSSRLSFNFSRSGNNLIIMPYDNKVQIDTPDSEAQLKLDSIYKLSYFKKRHMLEGSTFEKFKIVFDQKKTNNRTEISKAYESLKRDCRLKKIKITDYVNKEFIDKLQYFIIENYKSSEAFKMLPDGYVRIM